MAFRLMMLVGWYVAAVSIEDLDSIFGVEVNLHVD